VAVVVGGGGGNLKWLTIFPTGAWLIAKMVYENIKACDDMIAGAEATASYRRLGHIHGDLDSLNAKIDTSQGDLTGIKSSLDKIMKMLWWVPKKPGSTP
jgi:hypothetical protein